MQDLVGNKGHSILHFIRNQDDTFQQLYFDELILPHRRCYNNQEMVQYWYYKNAQLLLKQSCYFHHTIITLATTNPANETALILASSNFYFPEKTAENNTQITNFVYRISHILRLSKVNQESYFFFLIAYYNKKKRIIIHRSSLQNKFYGSF